MVGAEVVPIATGMSLREAFCVFDRDGSGTLTTDECVAILTRQSGGLPMTLADAQEFVSIFDCNGDGVLDYGEFCAAMSQTSLPDAVSSTVTTTTTTMLTTTTSTTISAPPLESVMPTAAPINGPDMAVVKRILDGEAWAAVEAAQASDGVTLWEAFKRQKALIKAREMDDMQMLEWMGAVEHNLDARYLNTDELSTAGDDNSVHLLLVLASARVGRAADWLRDTVPLDLFVASDKPLSDATRVELFHAWAGAKNYMSTARFQAEVLPALADIVRRQSHLSGSGSSGGTALGYFGVHDVASVACTCLYSLADSDDRDELVVTADELGLVEATLGIVKPLLGTQDLLTVCHTSGLSQTILESLSRPEGFEERLAAALGVPDLQMGLLPDSYWDG